MSDSVGNVIYAPGSSKKGFTTDLELLQSTSGWTQFGVTLKQGQGVLAVGTPLTKDSATGTYVAASPTATSGVEGFLRLETDTGVVGTDLPRLGNCVDKGVLKYSLIKAANGATDLTAGLLTSLGARINANRDSLYL
jgi:hypothetical protein